jgi:sarcosine oxidase, subunit delta
MLLITCPWCGTRDEEEFTYGSVWEKRRPPDSPSLTDEQWARYLYVEKNVRGSALERWRHTNGCRQWFLVERHTVTHEIARVLQLEEVPISAGGVDLPAMMSGPVGT